jgi:hypothetical protein
LSVCNCSGEVGGSTVACRSRCSDETVVLNHDLYVILEDCPCFVDGCLGPPFAYSNIESTHRRHDVVGDANDGGSRGCVSSCRCKSHSIIDLCEEDLIGCGWIPLDFHPVQVLVQLGFCDGTVGVTEGG